MNGRHPQTKYTRFILGFISLFLWVIIGLPSAAQAHYGNVARVPGQIVVGLNPLVGATIGEINLTYDTTVLDQLAGTIYLLQVAPDADELLTLEAMEFDPRLDFAEFNMIGESPEFSGQDAWAWGGQDDGPFTAQYALSTLNIPPAHAISQGAGTTVAVLDTGVQGDHPALADVMANAGYDFVDEDDQADDEFNGLDDDGDGLIDEAAGHGTHVAGIVHLTAPQAQIMPVRVLDSDGRGDIYAVARGIVFAAGQQADVINLSLGLPGRSRLLRDVIRQATQQGSVVVAAAGNMGTMARQYPAASQCALGVTSVGADGRHSAFASYGNWVAFAVPGENIYSTFPDSGYASWSGTSMATPFVAGQAALLRSASPDLNVRQIAHLISHTAQNLDGLNPARSGRLGAGMPDVHASLMQLLSGDLLTTNNGILSGACVNGQSSGSD